MAVNHGRCIDRHHIRSLDKVHLRCLRHIAEIKWQDKVPNTEVLQRCNTTGVEAIVMCSQLRWCSHLAGMPDHRIPKIVFYFELQQGSRPRGRPKKRYKDILKNNLRSTGIDINCWESTTASRSTWQAPSCAGVMSYEDQRSAREMIQRRQRRKDITSASTAQSSQRTCL